MSDSPDAWPVPGPIRGVIFDLHSTLVDQGSAQEWLQRALDVSPHELTPAAADELVAFLDRIWENARVHDPDSLRDLSADAHARVFHRLLAEGPGIDPGLGDALYDCLLDTWHAYDDAVPVLAELTEAGVAIAVLSNVGVPVQHVLDREGISPYADVTVLSWQVGAVKPDAPIFERALAQLGLSPRRGPDGRRQRQGRRRRSTPRHAHADPPAHRRSRARARRRDGARAGTELVLRSLTTGSGLGVLLEHHAKAQQRQIGLMVRDAT